MGTGEQLNEHILGDRWPPTDQRLEMLEEAVTVMRALWTGDEVDHVGTHYRVENARLYSCPDTPPPVYVSAFGPKAAEVAARIGDGLVHTAPDADTVQTYRRAGGTGPVLAATKVCYGADEAVARKLAFRLWPNGGLAGELAQELRTTAHLEQACTMVSEDDALAHKPMGPDPEVHAASLRTFLEAGFDRVYLQQIGPDQQAFLRFYRDEVLPRVGV